MTTSRQEAIIELNTAETQQFNERDTDFLGLVSAPANELTQVSERTVLIYGAAGNDELAAWNCRVGFEFRAPTQ